MLRRLMNESWLTRLKALIEADGRSLRQVSIDAGLGPNFVQQMLKDGKDPTIEKLQAVLLALGQDKLLFVMTGVDLSPSDIEFLRLLKAAPENVRGSIRQILDAVKAV